MVVAIAIALLIGLVAGLYAGKKIGLANAIAQAMKVADDEKKADQEPPAYIVVLGKSYDPGKIQSYVMALPSIYKKYQGSYVAMATDVELLEGEFNYMSMLVSKWPSVKHAQDFWNSEEYQEAKKLRDDIGEFNIFIVKGLPENFAID